MRSLMILCVVACVALMAGVANAENPGQISDNALAQMGLGGMQTISDAQGTDIRGMGFAWVGGSSYIRGLLNSNFSYGAVSARPDALAIGGSVAVIANGQVANMPNLGTFFNLQGTFVAGGSFAYAR